MFGSRTVITVAHNLYQRHGNYADKVVVVPAASAGREPFGRFEVTGRSFDWHQKWADERLPDYEADQYDLGVIWLPESVGDRTKWFDLSYMSDAESKPGRGLISCGYREGTTILSAQPGEVVDVVDGMVQNTADFGGGLSGAPVWLQNQAFPYICTVALHKGEGRTADRRPVSIALRLTKEHYEVIRKWTKQTGPNLQYRVRTGAEVDGGKQKTPALKSSKEQLTKRDIAFAEKVEGYCLEIMHRDGDVTFPGCSVDRSLDSAGKAKALAAELAHCLDNDARKALIMCLKQWRSSAETLAETHRIHVTVDNETGYATADLQERSKRKR